MSDRWAVVLAAAAALGAAHPAPVPLVVALALAAAALLVRQPWLLCLAIAVLVSSLAARALAGLDGIETGAVATEVPLLTDPEPSGGGLRMEVRLAGRRVEARADGAAADLLAPRLAGERVRVQGHVEPPPPDAPWLVTRHIAGRLSIHQVGSWRPGHPPSRLANGLRRTLLGGADSLSPTQRALFSGVVIGDDRAQPAHLADDFLGAGLTHLLAVSGQNVAFVLALASPLTRRLGLWPRLGVTLAVVGLFGLVTRFEPSVLRASAMAALAATLTTIGTPASRIRVIALAVTALLLVDPLLVRSVGFQLSVAASAAILLLAPRLVTTLPGPAVLRGALAVTVAAQLGVAPVLLATFGPVPVASIPANLLAVPVAGAVMVWGLTGGLLAGVLGGDAAVILHLPTRALLAWLETVAARTAALPLGELDRGHLAVAAAGLGLAAFAGACTHDAIARRCRRLRQLGLGTTALAVVAVVLTANASPPLRAALAPGIVRWHSGSTDVVVLGGAGWRDRLAVRPTLEALRRARVQTVDVVVVADADVPAPVVSAVVARHRTGTVLAGRASELDPTTLPVTVVPADGAELEVGDLVVRVVVVPDRLVVEARPP